MPDALELPGMLRAVIPLVSRQRSAGVGGRVIHEFVADCLRRARRERFAGRSSGLVPGFAAVVGALDDLSEPAAGLRRVNAIRIGRRPLEVVQLPSSKVRAAHLPVFAFAVCRKNECAFARAYQDPYLAHALPPSLRTTVPDFI